MQRAARAAVRVAGQATKLAQSPVGMRQLRSAVGAVPSAVAVWPPAQPSVAASTASTSGTNTVKGAGASAGNLLDIIGEEDDETRFRKRQSDRGPPRGRRDSAKDVSGKGGRGRDSQFESKASSTGAGAAAAEGEASPAVDDGPVTELDLLTLSPRALALLPPELAQEIMARTEAAEEVPFPTRTRAKPVKLGATPIVPELPESAVPSVLAAVSRSQFGGPAPKLEEAGAAAEGSDDDEDEEDGPRRGRGRRGQDDGEASGSQTGIAVAMRRLNDDEAKLVLSALKSDATYTGPAMHAVLTGDGRILPLTDEDADRIARLQALPATGIPPALMADPAARAAILLRGTMLRRALRANYSRTGLDRIAAVAAVQKGEQAFPKAGSPFSARRDDVYRAGQDPILDKALPFDARSVTFLSNMSWNSHPNAQGVDRRAVVLANVAGLGVLPQAVGWLKAIAGPRYSARSGQLKLSSDAFPTAAGNKRAVLENLANLVKEANSLAGKHGPLKINKPLPAYAHA